MPVPEDERLAQGLTRRQRRLLLWMPIVGVWLVLGVIAKNPEGGRDWPTFLAMGLTASVVLAGLWLVLVRIVANRPRDRRSAEEKLAEKGSRAALIYGDSKAPQPSAGLAGRDEDEDETDDTPDGPQEGD